MLVFISSEENLPQQLCHPAMMICTDGIALSPRGFRAQGVPHPRNFGAFPRVLGLFVREKGTLTLEEAIWKMSGLPAQVFKWEDCGLVREGYARDRVASLATRTAEPLGEPISFADEEILVNDHYLGGGYAVMGEAEREAIYLFAQQEGILLDPVYTGRAAAGMIDLIRKGCFKAGEAVLFWHTGGVPALFAAPYNRLLC